jgi:hypothetical protein
MASLNAHCRQASSHRGTSPRLGPPSDSMPREAPPSRRGRGTAHNFILEESQPKWWPLEHRSFHKFHLVRPLKLRTIWHKGAKPTLVFISCRLRLPEMETTKMNGASCSLKSKPRAQG